MARPVNANAKQTRSSILTAGAEQFAQHGYDATTMREIASDAQVSLGMIRHYFGNKAGLYRTCVEGAYAAIASGRDDDSTACRLVLWDMMQQGDRKLLQHMTQVYLSARDKYT